MNTEKIKQQIKALDTENKIRELKVYTKDDSVYIIFDDVFKVIVNKWNLIFCRVDKEYWDNAVDLYIEHYIDLLDYYIFFPPFFKENKDKIKQIVKPLLKQGA